MSFLKRVQSQYAILASNEIKTEEPIKIEWDFDANTFEILVDDIAYAIIDHVSSPSEVDLDKVRTWVENTYDSGDYKSSMYIAPRLSLDEFKK